MNIRAKNQKPETNTYLPPIPRTTYCSKKLALVLPLSPPARAMALTW